MQSVARSSTALAGNARTAFGATNFKAVLAHYWVVRHIQNSDIRTRMGAQCHDPLPTNPVVNKLHTS